MDMFPPAWGMRAATEGDARVILFGQFHLGSRASLNSLVLATGICRAFPMARGLRSGFAHLFTFHSHFRAPGRNFYRMKTSREEPRMARKHRWGNDPGSDFAEMGKIAVRGIGKARDMFKRRAARKDLPENLRDLVANIEAFDPVRRAKREQPYHDRLFGYLQGKYGKAVTMEVTRGRSRPDIVVWDTVAIEVKGPTGSGELNTVASKIIRYKQHFKQFVCVLFDIEDPVHFKEWLRGIEQNHPEVIVIPK